MNLNKIIKSSPAFIFPATINLVSLLVFTRTLSLEEYGELSLALISIEFIQGALFQWIKLAMMRFYKNEDTTMSVGTGLQFNLGVSILLLLFGFLCFLLGKYFFKYDPMFILLIMIGTILRGLYNYIQDHIRISETSLRRYTIFAVTANAAFYVPAIAYVWIFKRVNVNQILTVQVVGLFIYMAFFSLNKLKAVKNALTRFYKKSIYIEFLKYGIPLIIVYLASSMFIRVDRYIIEATVGLRALGKYSAAFSLSNLAIGAFFTILTLPTYPEIIRQLNAGNEQEAKNIYDANGNLILAISVPSVLISCLFNHVLCHLFFGAKGDAIETVFPYVVVGTFLFNFKQHYFDQVFQFCKRTKVYMILGSIIGVAHLVMSYILCRIYGTNGVSGSNMLLNLVSIIFTYFYAKSFFKITFNKWLSISTFAVALILSCLFLFKGNVSFF